MPRSSPFIVVLSDDDRAVLEQRSSSRTVAHRDVLRARIVLLAAEGVANVEIARRVGVCVDVASKWRKRFCEEGRAGLSDRKRSGRPRRFSGEVVAHVKAMACEPPGRRELPLVRWSSHELAAQAVTEGLVEAISPSTVRRWLHGAAIKPWRYRSWIFPRDPYFADKAARVLDLYERLVDGRPLEEDEFVISADEKSQLQALSGATVTSRPHRGACGASSSSIAGAARSPTSAPTTCSGPCSLARWRRRPASSRSWPSWTR